AAANQVVVLCAEAENSGLVELIVQVDQAALDGAAKMQIVLALFPADVVGPSVVVASEERGGVVTEGEPTLNADALNGIGSRLERERSPESGDACGVGSRAAVGDFARIAKTEVIDEARREDMGFVRQEVLRGDRKSSVGVGDEQQRIKNGGFGEAIEFVATTELVILTEGMIDPADGGVEVLNVGLREWHGRLLTGGNCRGQGERWRSGRPCGVVDDGAAESAAKLIALDAIGSGRRGKEILGVEHRIANEFEGVSVETVCARLGDDVNDAARVGAVLRAVVAGLDAEFLERVGERKGLIDVGVFVHVVAAVELVADGILAGSICGESDGTGES